VVRELQKEVAVGQVVVLGQVQEALGSMME